MTIRIFCATAPPNVSVTGLSTAACSKAAAELAVDPVLLRYVNRLSDLLFVLARVVNHRGGVPETEW